MKKIPSPAMIVALVALFVSLAGNAAAVTALVTSKQIKDKTIQIRDIARTAVSSLRGRQGPAGAAGPQGIRGPMGSTGAQGPAGKSFDSSEMQKICWAIRDIQKQVDGINSLLGRSPASWFLDDFRYKVCVY
jgi:hypothetical protein